MSGQPQSSIRRAGSTSPSAPAATGFMIPAAYGEAEWRAWMARMSRKARLKQDQEELLSRYLDALRTRNAVDETQTRPIP